MRRRVCGRSAGKKVPEVVMPKIFKWYKDDFGFSKQEILVSPAYTVCVCVCVYVCMVEYTITYVYMYMCMSVCLCHT